jgi:hypothetical protein
MRTMLSACLQSLLLTTHGGVASLLTAKVGKMSLHEMRTAVAKQQEVRAHTLEHINHVDMQIE